MVKNDLERALVKGDSERPVMAVLKKHPLVVCRSVGFVYPNKVAPEFRFGTDYRADFVALGPFSGGWDIHFLELQAPYARLFTKCGRIAKSLNEAVAQIDSWRTYIERHRDSILHELSKHVQRTELVWEFRNEEPGDHCGWPLYHPKASLAWYFHIVIGRRQHLSEADLERKGAFRKNHEINVMTYDRLLDAAETLDDEEKGMS